MRFSLGQRDPSTYRLDRAFGEREHKTDYGETLAVRHDLALDLLEVLFEHELLWFGRHAQIRTDRCAEDAEQGADTEACDTAEGRLERAALDCLLDQFLL